MLRFLVAVFVALLAMSFGARAQQADLGRFRVGMTAPEARAAAPEQQWEEQNFGADLTVLTAERPIRIGRVPFTPQLNFRDGRLSVVQFSGGGAINEHGQCDDALAETVAALEAHIGALDSHRAPGEFGAVVESRETNDGSEVRYYQPNAETHVGYATQRTNGYVQASSMATPIPPHDLACALSIEMQAALTDFEPLPPPTSEELAGAQETEPDWAVRPDPRVTELTMPAHAVGHAGRVRVRLDCIVIAEQRLNCAVESEEPQGMHFGDGALAASRFYRIEPVIDGQPTLGRRVRFTIRYELGAFAQPQ